MINLQNKFDSISKSIWLTLLAIFGLSFGLTSLTSFSFLQSVEARNSKCNCVFYAKDNVPSLPPGLFTLKDKKNIINSYEPTVGAVAIIDNKVNRSGHVAVVRSVNSDGTITIQESNWGGCGIGKRTKTPAKLNILGYFKP